MIRQSSRPSGFTLIELMIVTAIIGVLASVAIPNFTRLTLRSKVAERATIMLRIKQQVVDYHVRNGRVIDSGGSAYANPPSAPSPSKRPMQNGVTLWSQYFSGNGSASGNVTAELEGAFYYQYWIQTTEVAGSSAINLWAAGDLDGDGNVSWKQMQWARTNGVYQLLAEFPPAGQEDDAGAYATF